MYWVDPKFDLEKKQYAIFRQNCRKHPKYSKNNKKIMKNKGKALFYLITSDDWEGLFWINPLKIFFRKIVPIFVHILT